MSGDAQDVHPAGLDLHHEREVQARAHHPAHVPRSSREVNSLLPGSLAARLQGAGLPVHPLLRRELDEQTSLSAARGDLLSLTVISTHWPG